MDININECDRIFVHTTPGAEPEVYVPMPIEGSPRGREVQEDALILEQLEPRGTVFSSDEAGVSGASGESLPTMIRMTDGRGRPQSSRRRRFPRTSLYDDLTIRYHANDSGSEVESDCEEDDDDEEYYEALNLRGLSELLQDEGQRNDFTAAAADILQELGVAADGAEESEPDQTFEWSDDFRSFEGHAEEFSRNPGPIISSADPVEIFTTIFDNDIIDNIVHQTNEYAWNYIAEFSETGQEIPKNLYQWYETTRDEVYRYLAVIMFMAIDPRGCIEDYWRTTGHLKMDLFRSIMSKNRYKMLSRFFHVVDNGNIPHDVHSHARKVAKIQPLVDHCNSRFQAIYSPGRELSLDESLLLWKGRLSWVQCNRSKAARFGMKLFDLVEASTGYLLKTIIYTGKGSASHDGPLHGFTKPTAKIVLQLMEGYYDAGHLLVMDNWYNQLSLTRYLKQQRGTDVLGTLNRRREHVPNVIKNIGPRDLAQGQVIGTHCRDMSIVSWMDTKLVSILSTYHDTTVAPNIRAGVERPKPISAIEYNKFMGGVDLKDQKLSGYLMERKRGLKWYIKVFRRLLNTSILNSYIIYLKNPLNIKIHSHRQFRIQLAEDLLKRFPKSHRDVPRPLPAACEIRLDVSIFHVPDHTPVVNGRKSKRRCARCAARNVRTQNTFMCKTCDVGLCLGKCWLEYHTLANLS